MDRFFITRWTDLTHDLSDIATIEARVFARPWYRSELRNLLARTQHINAFSAVDSCNQVVGYLIYALRTDSVEIARLAVDPAWRRRGVASCLVNDAMHHAADRSQIVTTLVPDTDVGAHWLFAACGFLAVHVHRGWYAGQDYYEFHGSLSISRLSNHKARRVKC